MTTTLGRHIVRRTVVALVGVAICVLIGALVAAPRISAFAVSVHQRSTTRELAAWADDYRTLEDYVEAGRAVGMLEYIPNYYVPQDGYRSDARTEAVLERQRADTTRVIIDALKEFSGEDYGNDAARWRRWYVDHEHTSQPHG